MIGAVPPAIGWSVAARDVGDPRVIALAAFVWQVPHFWRLLLQRGDEDAAAGLPTLKQTRSQPACRRLTFVSLCAAALSAPLLSWLGVAHSLGSALAQVVAGLLLLRSGFALMRQDITARTPFGAINLFACAVMVLLVADAIGTAGNGPLC